MFGRRPSHKNDIIAALDIGTTRVACAIARMGEDEKAEIIGTGQHMMRGLKRGIIVDMDAIVGAIVEAVSSAERQADETIRKIYISVPASVVQSKNHRVEMPILSGSVSPDDLQTLSQQVHDFVHEMGHEALHVIPLSYDLDDQKGIHDPKGMYGEHLCAHLHLLTVPTNVLRNFLACMTRAHLEVSGYVAAPHATGLAMLVPDEMELGTALIDMGGGATAFAAYVNGRSTFLTSVPIGGNHITQDIARVFSTPLSHAERLKALYGAAITLSSDERESINVPQVGEDAATQGMTISKANLNQVVQPRLEEIFLHLKRRLDAHPESALLSRIVLSGGASQLTGIRDFVSQMLGRHVRIAHTHSLGGRGAGLDFATCAGVLMYAAKEAAFQVTQKPKGKASLWRRMKAWMDGGV